MTTFRDWFVEQEDQPYPHEIEIINSLKHMPSSEQVRRDISLHNPKKGRFAQVEEDMLDKDAELKKVLLDVLEGRIRDASTNRMMQAYVNMNRQNHQEYLNQSPNPNTGSHAWHRAWIQAYDNWLEELRSLNA